MTLSQTHIYQAFFFDNRMKSCFYTGSSFSSYREDMSMDELLEIGFDIIQEGEFMPVLKRQIETLLGEGNYVSDYWEFGPDCFSMYWWIRKEVYEEKLLKIRQWAEYEGISEWIEINEEI